VRDRVLLVAAVAGQIAHAIAEEATASMAGFTGLRGRTKPLLKLALQARTGLDFVSRPKRAGTFFTDLFAWMREGVLADMVRSIERPGYVDPKSFRQQIEAPDWTTWNLLLMDLYAKHLRSIQRVEPIGNRI